ncbi:MAG: alkaline phosphatase, partial [Flavobacteriaceae bacterium]|nr:alkaline phosphatase [Flavobacteriaceae bacterium]
MKRSFLISFFFILLGCGQNAKNHNEYPNIILLIGDGNGLSQISAGNYVMNNQTAFDRFEFVGIIKVHADEISLLTDSAAAGTAIACGKKTKNGMLGMDAEKNELVSILEILKEKGYQTGLIATSTIVHATPAAFYAHVEARNEYELIASQLMSSSVDFFVGGGEKYFVEREDGKNLMVESKQFEFVGNLEDFQSSKSEKIGYLTHENNPPSLLEGRTPT